MEWSGASPLERQKKLEGVTAARMADTYYSLHTAGLEEPIYVSEVAEKAMNPNFRFFELSTCGPTITRADELVVRVWVRSEQMQQYQYLLDLTVQLQALQFIGKSLDTFHHPLPPNCVIFHLTDGLYTSFTDMSSKQPALADLKPPLKSQPSRIMPTSTYESLMKLQTLDTCIQDAIASRDKIASDISGFLEEHRGEIEPVERMPEAEERTKTVENAVSMQRKRLEVARKRRSELHTSLQERRNAMQNGRKAQDSTERDMTGAKPLLDDKRKDSDKQTDDIHGQRRRISEDLLGIYPIEPIPNKTLSFRIRGLYLPNSDFENVQEDETAAALGYVAHLVTLLSAYHSVALPYPIHALGSNSTIQDPISLTTAATTGGTAQSRTYPLFMKSTIRYRFEYGVFLLNKDIEILANWLGLRLLDIRQTLPNLMYVLYVATAGKGELPARKAGGIKGLLRYPGNSSGFSTPSLSRVASDDSTVVDGKTSRLGKGEEKAKALVEAVDGADHVSSLKGGYGGVKKANGSIKEPARLKEVT